ncbi:DUF4491 family protein [Tannerella forsythia]|uniref:DUF4491 family protein n=1 Tax=Tannerella forsythia TaxID=28112 RepID=A0A3P1XKN4_TANFO|nr:DUF4491 family protein [Tannerella forsythia]RRD57443.1 DUF4491 family protein [Tannerella forsythia]
MTEFLTTYNLWGLTTGISTFLIIGLFHPIVIKTEYYFGTACWWVFLIAGLILTGVSIMLDHIFLSTLAGVVAFSCFWSIIEIFEQAQRVEKGWFPANPKRRKKK